MTPGSSGGRPLRKDLSPALVAGLFRRQLLAKAAIAASRVGSYPHHSKTRVQKMKDLPVTAVTPAQIAGRPNLPMKRAGPEDYKQLAKRCAEIASECSAPTVAEALRALALDYLTRAAKLRANQSRQGRHRTGRPKRLADKRHELTTNPNE